MANHKSGGEGARSRSNSQRQSFGPEPELRFDRNPIWDIPLTQEDVNQAKTIDDLERIRLEAWVKECIKCGIPPDDAAKLLEMKTL